MSDNIKELVEQLRDDAKRHNPHLYKNSFQWEAADALEDLAEWKRQALALEVTWDVQAVGRLIKVPLGANILPAIQPALEAMAGEVAFVKAQLAGTNKNIAGWLQARDDATKRAEAAEAEVERLTIERDASARHVAMVHDVLAEKVAEVERLRAALAPFAAIKADDGDTFDTWHDGVIIRCEITVGDLKKARKALEEK